jgi:aldose 1-epimerase
VLTYTSADGKEGYPGALSVTAAYSLDDKGELKIEYRATTDKPTVVNLTGHAYFNLTGATSNATVMRHRLTISAETYTPGDVGLIPTGEFRSVAGTAFDFRKSAEIGARIRAGRDAQLVLAKGYDHNWVIARTPSSAVRLNARLEDPESGRVLEVLSNQPGLQFYSGNFLDATVVGKGGRVYRQGDGLCLEL